MTKIQTAQINWQTDDNGITVPTSSDFGDVYFSKADGLAESRYVFIDGNDLPQRLANLSDFETFTLGEIGFGTGLNVLAIWQLWQAVKPDNHSRLHIITTEKFPLTKADLSQALSVWQELQLFSQQLIDNYPPPLAGCHRLNFWADRLTLDIWLGDASDSLAKVMGNAKVNAWLLDGFAPACNGELWADSLFSQIARLSDKTTTLATFSVASIVKQGLKQHGFTLTKRKGFGKKREMLTAKFIQPCEKSIDFKTLIFRFNKKIKPYFLSLPFTTSFDRQHRTRKKSAKKADFKLPNVTAPQKALNIAVIGAGVAGLSVAWALAQRGHKVTVFDKNEPLAGASGNVRAFLAPKLTSLKRLESNLHAIGYLASCRFYPAISEQTGVEILQTTGCLDLLSHNRLELADVQDFPPEFVQLLNTQQAENLAGTAVGQAIFLPNAGLIDTANFAKAVLRHANIAFQQATLTNSRQYDKQVILDFDNCVSSFDHVILCTALQTCDFLPTLKRFNYSRGQVSWFEVNNQTSLPKLPLKYGSYYAQFRQHSHDYVLLGASFIRDTLDTTPATADHNINRQDFLHALPQFKRLITLDKNWQGRASLRCQTVDYLPLVGQVWQDDINIDSRVWTFSALGSKGYAYAPIASELMAGLIGGEVLPLSSNMVKRLSPNRVILQS